MSLIFKHLFVLSFVSMALSTSHAANNSLAPSAVELKKMIVKHCSNCHIGSGDEVGKYGDFTKAGVLQLREKLSPNILYKKIQSGEMPKSDYGDFLSSQEKEKFLNIIQSWYNANQPLLEAVNNKDFVSNEEVLGLILEDLQSKSVAEQKDLRYFSFTHLHNNPNLSVQYNNTLQAFSKLLNGLSWSKEIIQPRDLDGRGVVFAVSLKDYDWDTDKWQKLLGNGKYPYGLEYGKNQVVHKQIKELTGAGLPIARADWVVQNASRPPIYHEVLGLPNNLQDLEDLLNVKRFENINNLNVYRAGFSDSGVSQHNRMIERHSAKYGAYWISYDFASSVGLQDLFKNPLGPDYSGRKFDSKPFSHDGGEVIFNLPNGLQAYLLVDAKGQRIDKGPTSIVSDPSQPDRAVVNGISCMGCHNQGMIIKSDQVHSVFESGGFSAFSAFDQFAVKGLYGKLSEMSDLMQNDRSRFLSAQEKSGVNNVTPEVTLSTSQGYQQSLDFNQMAYELGFNPDFVKEKMDKGELDLAPDALLLFAQGISSTVKRESFEFNFQILAESLGLAIEEDDSGPVYPDGKVKQISLGWFYSCALTGENVRCWGNNFPGKLSVPNDLKNPTQISVGTDYACTLTSDGVRCWGSNEYGQIDVPKDLKNPMQISAGGNHVCALTAEGIRCWGNNHNKQNDVPKDLKNPTQVSAGGGYTCALASEGVRCWGDNRHNQIDVPKDLKNPTQISAGGKHVCVLTSKGVRCWGEKGFNQIEVPKDLKNPTQISAGGYHTCALTGEGVRCWGKSSDGQLIIPKDLKNPTQISAGGNHTCALTVEGVHCWGRSSEGQLNVPQDLKNPAQTTYSCEVYSCAD